MTGPTVGALDVVGLLSLMPGRRMNQVFFGEAGTDGFLAVLAVAAILVGMTLSRRKTGQV